MLETIGSVDVDMVRYNHWQLNETQETEVITTCFMPNGNCITLTCPAMYTMAQLKVDLWEKAEDYPLFGFLEDKSNYIIKAIKSFSAILEEIHDEKQRIIDIQPFFAIFKLERRQEKESSDLKQNISILIGKKLEDFKVTKNAEVNDFRQRIDKFSSRIRSERANKKPREKILLQHPPILIENFDVLQTNSVRFVATVNLPPDESVATITMEVSRFMKADEFLENILNRIRKRCSISHYVIDDMVLKVSGQEEFLVGDYPLAQYQFIHECLANNESPTFRLTQVSDVLDYMCERPVSKKLSSRKYSRSQSTKKLSSWELQKNFKVTIDTIRNLKIESTKFVDLGVRVGLFHGGRPLCKPQNSRNIQVSGDENGCASAEWHQSLQFNLKICDIPRMARLCFVIYYLDKNAQCVYRECKKPLYWVNTTIFDFKGQLKIEGQTLYTWPTEAKFSNSDEILLPLGSVEQNPRTEEGPCITIEFPIHLMGVKFFYPCDNEIPVMARVRQIQNQLQHSSHISPIIIKTCEDFMHNEKISKISAPEREEIWKMRYNCMTILPDFLPYLLCCVEWNKHDNVSEVVNILRQWPGAEMSVEQVLKLLDYTYADKSVRKFAVNCLRKKSDEILQMYLLQLIQALKHELYLHCDLVELLLDRAVKNQRIGQYLFWYLRSELCVQSVEIRFSLILEAYLKASPEHIGTLLKQHYCLERFKSCNDQCKVLPKEKAKERLEQLLKSFSANEDLMNVISPLDPNVRWRKIIDNKFKIMDSKKKPILFHCENVDPNGREIQLIFKEGDDLRQDMLILQMLKIMDRIWKNNNLDFRLSIYSCLNMDNGLGMIEPVGDSETVANILKSNGAGLIPKTEALFDWLKEHNPTEEGLEKAIMEFTMSCAGYCVATYVLGIADRHPNNIMVKKNGQMFHIDFGHILGNFKEKFGIKRERVAFVLTNDFVHVINRGDKLKKDDFEKFQKLCEEAFKILRKNGCLLLSLFSMMIQTGLPELTSNESLRYLRDTLVLECPEEDALNNFRSKFEEALKNSWTTFNWFFHMINRNN